VPSEPLEADLIDRLVRYGLGHGEARCYVAMLAPRAFKVSEVARKAGLPRSRSYELIRSLVRSGLCSEVAGGRVARFRAAPPNEAIGRLEAFLGEQERRRAAALSSIVRVLDRRSSGAGSEDEPVRTLRRGEQVFGAYNHLLREAREEIVTAMAMPWLPWSPVLRLSPVERLAAGVRMRAVHERGVCSSDTHRESVSFYHDKGVEIRLVDAVGAQFTVFDRRRSILHLTMPQAGTHQLESLQINHAGFGQTLQQAFECLWEQGTPFAEAMREVSGSPRTGTRSDPRKPGEPHERGGPPERAGTPAPRQLVGRGGDGRFVGYD
jgi:sugar-specific transcriptional regulator TrmB